MEINRMFDWKGKKILVVEDDHDNFNYLDILLKSTSARVVHAPSGEKAVSCLRRHRFFNVILMDIRLPGMSGLETTLKMLELCPGLKIIAQTAFAYDYNREQALGAGCVDYIAKPIPANEMLMLIRKYLEN